jgi:hypothetical protein
MLFTFSTIRGANYLCVSLEKSKCSHHKFMTTLTRNGGARKWWNLKVGMPFTLSPIRRAITINSLYNHAHFSHIFCLCHTFFGNHPFEEETPLFRITITLVSSTKNLQSFFSKCGYNGRNLGQILGFCKLWFPFGNVSVALCSSCVN